MRCNKNCGRGGQQTVSFRKESGAEEDGGREQNRSPTFESLQLDTLSCLRVFVSTRVRDFLDTVDSGTL